jgi:hypothetical protein
MKGLWMVILALGVWSGGSGAALARSEPAAVRLVEVLELEKTTTEAVALAVVEMAAGIPGWKDHEDILLDYVEERLGWGALQPMVAAWVAETFTEKELEELIRFHSTPVGKKWVSASPAMSFRMENWVRERFTADLDVLELRMKNRELERLMNESVFFDGAPAGREPGE